LTHGQAIIRDLCLGGQLDCSGTCVDINSDHNNCGSCGNACSNNNAYQKCCAGECQNVRNSDAHCGDCFRK
ncbi:8367_t:CDS:2, partial [Acaulospora morrowiae]